MSDSADDTGATRVETMAVVASRALCDGEVCFVGIGVPSTAANLARATHAPGLVLIYESGCIGAKPTRLPLSIGDGELAETADVVVSVPEIFAYWLQPGRIGVGFLGGAQIDRFANLNSTVIGDYDEPTVRLPGAGGAPEIAGSCQSVIVMMRQSDRTFVDHLGFRTTVGFGDGPGERARLGLTGAGPTLVVTDLGILRPDAENCELTLTGGTVGERGDRTRRQFLGDDYVNRSATPADAFGAPFTELLNRYAWGDIWTRPGLDRPTRSAITVAMLVALGRSDELALHVRAARRNGLSVEQIREILLQTAIYCGVPAARNAFAVATDTLAQIDAEAGA